LNQEVRYTAAGCPSWLKTRFYSKVFAFLQKPYQQRFNEAGRRLCLLPDYVSEA
jgi:hypothetical protein